MPTFHPDSFLRHPPYKVYRGPYQDNHPLALTLSIMSVESAQCAVGTPGLTVPPNTPMATLTSISGYGHYYTSPEPTPLLGAGGKDIALNLSFEIVEDDDHIFISKAAAVWQGPVIPKRAIIPLPVRVRAMHAGTVQHHTVTIPVEPTFSCEASTLSHDMQVCTNEVAQEHRVDMFQSISATPGLRSWSFEVRHFSCQHGSIH